MANPHAVEIQLSQEEQVVLENWVRRRSTAQGLALRAQIVLACAMPGKTNLAVASELGVSNLTVGKWRRRFADQGLEGLCDAPRSGAPRKILDQHVEQIISTTLEKQPINSTHWSTRLLAKELGMSQSAISRVWRAFGLAPHRVDSFKLSTDPNFVAKVRDIVGLYLSPPDRAIVLCVDEKPSIQATEGTAPILPMDLGQPERHTHDYRRYGTTDLFAALEVSTGRVIGECHRRHRSTEFRHFLATVDQATPPELDLHLILDNASIHKTTLIQRWLLRHPRFHFHFTPTSSSWLNLVECWFSILTARQLRRGEFSSTEVLERTIRNFIAENNRQPKPFVWSKSADQILESVANFCIRTSNSHH